MRSQREISDNLPAVDGFQKDNIKRDVISRIAAWREARARS